MLGVLYGQLPWLAVLDPYPHGRSVLRKHGWILDGYLSLSAIPFLCTKR